MQRHNTLGDIQSRFQIISAGPNKIFGPGGNWTPGTGPWAENQPGNDDISNWTQRKLGVAE